MNKSLNNTLYYKPKDDEWYTLYEDIEKELVNYRECLKDKVVYCNCDDYRTSNFYKYFKWEFHRYGIKKLIATTYTPNGKGLIATYEWNSEVFSELYGDGSFDSPECIEILKECDVVITNPPFSLFRKYIKVIFDYDKKFLVLGNENLIIHQPIESRFIANKMSYGFNPVKSFMKPNGKIEKLGFVSWYTNLIIKNHMCLKDEVVTHELYDYTSYVKYDNYDAINVDRIKYIPINYKGLMGVPITIFKFYDPKVFTIFFSDRFFKIDGKLKYQRVIIQLN